MNPSPFTLRSVGRVELVDADGREVKLRTRKTLLLLAILLSDEGAYWQRTTLARLVWQGKDPFSARDSLRTALSSLRRVFPADALVTDTRTILLRKGWVSVEESEGEFMPGFDEEWVVDRRLERRSRCVETHLLRAERSSDAGDSLRFAEAACRADPFDSDAAELRHRLLRERGQAEDATTLETAFRRRTQHEDADESDAETSVHPLVAAAEWLLDQEPEEACAMLASTQSQWFAMSVETALGVHRRVLAATERPSTDRRMVESGAFFLETLMGRIGPKLATVEAAYERAMSDRAWNLASRLTEVLAYGHLSAGRFERSHAYASSGYETAKARLSTNVAVNALVTLGIVQMHIGKSEESDVSIARAYELSTTQGQAALVSMSLAGLLLRQGKIAAAARLFESNRKHQHGERAAAWLLLLEAEILERSHEFDAALTALQRMKGVAPAAGQSAIALADEGLMRTYCKLQEDMLAAESFARVTKYRNQMGTVASTLERAETAPTVRTLRERLSERDLAAVFRNTSLL